MIGKLRFKLRPLTLKRRIKPRHDGFLRRHARIDRHLSKTRGVQLTLQLRPLWATLRHAKLTASRPEVNRERRHISRRPTLKRPKRRQRATVKCELLCRKPGRGEVLPVDVLHTVDRAFTESRQRPLNALLRLKGRLRLGGQVLLNERGVQVRHGREHFAGRHGIAHIAAEILPRTTTGAAPREAVKLGKVSTRLTAAHPGIAHRRASGCPQILTARGHRSTTTDVGSRRGSIRLAVGADACAIGRLTIGLR